MSNSPETKVRSVPMLLSPFTEIGRQLADILRNPTAFFGSLAGSALLTAGVAALVMFGPTFEVAAEDASDELDMEFMPGELVRLGPKLDPTQIPEKIIVAEQVAADDTTATTVTTEEKIAPKDEQKPNPKPSDIKPVEKPDPNKPKDTKVGPKNQDKNTPYDDLPTVDQLPGDPFGDAGGWSDTFKAGDPWATEVMKALNNLEVGTYAGEGKGGVYKFRLEVCPDGKLKAQRKQSTGDTTLDGAIDAEIARKKVSVPKNVSDLLKGKCQKIKYEFTWTGKTGGKGAVN